MAACLLYDQTAKNTVLHYLGTCLVTRALDEIGAKHLDVRIAYEAHSK